METVNQLDKEDQARKSRNVQMEMILENTNEDSSPIMRRVPLGGLKAAAANTGGLTPTSGDQNIGSPSGY